MSEKRSKSMVSDTSPIGGESMMMISNSDWSFSINPFILSFNNNSEGLGGTGPEGTTYKLSYSVGKIISSILHLSIRKEDNPTLLDTFMYWASLGFRKSIPTMQVLLPLKAIAEAILMLINVFPSPAILEVTKIFLHFFSLAI